MKKEETKFEKMLAKALDEAFAPFVARVEAVERKIHEKRMQTQQTTMKRIIRESLNPMVN